MSITVAYASTVNVVETLTSNVPAVSSNANSIVLSGYSTSQSLTSASSGPVTKCALYSQALSGGSATMDFTSLTGTQGTVDLTGLKLQVIKFLNPSTNTGKISITKGASNGLGLGSAGTTFTWPVYPGCELTMYLPEGTVDIDSTHKTWDLTGTTTEAISVAVIGG